VTAGTAGMGGSVTGGTVAAGLCGTVGKVGTAGRPGTAAAGAAVVSASWRAAWHELPPRSAHARTRTKNLAVEAIARTPSNY